MSEPTQSISFRLPATFARQLAEEGAKEKLSPGEYARRIVLEALTDEAGEHAKRELSAIRESVEKVREDLATTAAALLVNAGKTTVPDAQAWVRSTLLQ